MYNTVDQREREIREKVKRREEGGIV